MVRLSFVSSMMAVLAVTSAAAQGSRPSSPLVVDQQGRPLHGTFARLAVNAFVRDHASVLKFAPQRPCQGRPKSQPNASLVHHPAYKPLAWLLSLLSLPVVHAADCPDCLPVNEKCTSTYAWNIGGSCFCSGGSYAHFFSWPGVGEQNRGWCFTGGVACPPVCEVCNEKGCTQS